MPDERWKPLVGTPSKSPIPVNIVVPDPSPARSTTSDADSPTLLPPSPGASWIHQRRQGQYVPRPPVWKIYKPDQVYDAFQDAEDVGLVLQEKPLQLPGIDPVQLMADVFNEKPLVVNMMTSSAPMQSSTEHRKLRVRNNLDTENERPTPEKNLDSEQRPRVENKYADDDAPVDSGYPSTRNTAPHSPSASKTSLDRIQALTFTNPEPFSPQLEHPVRTYSPPISPGTRDPLGPYPANEAQAVNIEGLSPPRIEDHPSLCSGEKPETPSVAAPSNEDNETAIHSGKLPEKIASGNTITKKIANLLTGNKSPPAPTFEVIRKGQSHFSPKRVGPQVSEQVVSPQAAQPEQKERVKHKKRKPKTRDVRTVAVTIPLQDVPLRVKLHVSGVPRDQYITATIVSGPPSNIVVEEEPADHSAVRQAPFVEDRKENAQTESRSKAVEQAPSRPVTVATAAKDHYTGVEESIYPVEMSGALGNNSRPPRNIFGSLNRSIGRTFKRSSLLSRVFHQSEGGNSVDEHGRALSALGRAIPRLSPSSENSLMVPRFRGRGPIFLPRAGPSDARRGTGHALDDISLNFPSERPDSSTSEPRTVPEGGSPTSEPRTVPEGGSPAHWVAIQTNASRIARQSPSTSHTSVDQWVAAHAPGDAGVQIQGMSTRAGNVPRAPPPQQPASSTAESNQHSMRQTEEGVPAGDWAFGGTGQASSPHDCPSLITDSSSPNNGSGSSSYPAPPPATRPMPFRPNTMAEENRVPELAFPHNFPPAA